MVLSLAHSCVPSTFSPSLFGAQVLSLEANLVTDYSASVAEAFRYVAPAVTLNNVSFCNVTIAYTHPGQNDHIVTEAWLPLDWNERFQAIGGGGWVAGRFFLTYGGMQGAIADGYATITTDAGLGDAQEPTPWALNSPGNVNMYNLQNTASVSLNNEAIIGKSLIKSFYGREPKYSYWNGCSNGGRQGLMIAQRYPDLYDGIAAGAPAIHWNELMPFSQWPQQLMNELGEYPYPCELDALSAAALAACDGLDGVVDGAVADQHACLAKFDVFSVVGREAKCAQKNGTKMAVSRAAAVVANATWHGYSTKKYYGGLVPGTDLTGMLSIVQTSCNTTGCVGVPSMLGGLWLQLFVAKDPAFDIGHLSREEFDALVSSGRQQYTSLVESADPDLRRFRDLGGKIVSFHGLADTVIPPGSTEEYYNAVAGVTPDIQDFFRYFEAPGLTHCFGGKSGQPNNLFQQLRDWVEEGTAPEKTPIKFNVGPDETQNRILCPYPQKAQYVASCGDAALEKCWSCSGSENVAASKRSEPKHLELR
ncbi:putative feruloyl esterase [Colletotrichum tropicale]|nr:putative feruloyl esterase [Colletotrichum tropicale]